MLARGILGVQTIASIGYERYCRSMWGLYVDMQGLYDSGSYTASGNYPNNGESDGKH